MLRKLKKKPSCFGILTAAKIFPKEWPSLSQNFV